MKILFVVKNLKLSNGVSSFIMNYYRQLVSKDNLFFDFLVVSDDGSYYYDEIRENGSNIYFMPSLKSPFKLVKFLKELFKNNSYDILHSNVFNSNSIIAYYAKKYHVPVRILHSHATENGDKFIKKIRNFPFQLTSIKFSNYYFACSKLAGENIFKNRKFTVINNAIDIEKFRFSLIHRKKIREENNISDNTIIVGVVGRITTQKNPYFILEIADQLKKKNVNYKLWWFGNGDMDNEIFNIVKEHGLSDEIKFWGSIGNINEYYSAMDCFILPSLYEGLPVVGVEAQVSGLKCLFSKNITDELCLSDDCIFLPIDSAFTWSNQILELYNSKKFSRFQCDTSNYDINKLSNKLYNIYVKLINEMGDKK